MTRLERAVGASSENAMGWRSLAMLFAAGGLLAIAVLALPREPRGHPSLVLAIGGTAIAASVGFWLLADRIATRWMSPAIAFGTALITLVVIASGQPDGRYSLLYVWVVLEASFFLDVRTAAGHLGGLAVAYAIPLALLHGQADQWVMVVGTATVAGALVGLLQARIDRLSLHARTDPLTGVGNRRGFDEAFELELRTAQAARRRLTLVLADLDHFKSINDRHGHAVGDEVLHGFAALARRAWAGAHVARLGGDEFAILVPGVDHQQVRAGAAQLLQTISRDRRLATLGVSASIGVAAYPAHGESTATLLRAADCALYQAKEEGRGRAVAFSSQMSLAGPSARARTRGEPNLEAVVLLAETLDLRDASTAAHSQTVGRYAEMVAEALELEPARCARIRLAGLVHDVGKLGVSDTVLLKPDTLCKDEWEQMRRHPELGAQILDGVGLHDIAGWVLAHHERLDGPGYPHGLRGEDIPLEARILAVADTYEAMTSDRPYRAALTRHAAREELRRCAGTQFDPRVVGALLTTLESEDAGLTAA